MNSISVSAPGKLHLIGEHSVVYGKPAILTAVNKRCFVTITPRTDRSVEVITKNPSVTQVSSFEAVTIKGRSVQKQWELFAKTNDTTLLQEIVKRPLDYPFIAIYEAVTHFQNEAGFTLTIDSDIPIGSGLGSSAAVAVAVTAAVAAFFKHPIDKKTIFEMSLKAEQKMHGNPSGGDIAASCYGGLIWYQKISEYEKNITPLSFLLPEKLTDMLYIIDSGKPHESTGEMISMIKKRISKDTGQKVKVDEVFAMQEDIAHQLLGAMKKEDMEKFLDCIKRAEKNLEALGVVSDLTTVCIREIEERGGVAKICGAGGREKASGIIFCIHTNSVVVWETAKKYHMHAEKIAINEEGVRIENA